MLLLKYIDFQNNCNILELSKYICCLDQLNLKHGRLIVVVFLLFYWTNALSLLPLGLVSRNLESYKSKASQDSTPTIRLYTMV